MPQTRLRALYDVLTGLVARPEPGVLVVACADHELLYLLHTLARLDEHSPADRVWVVPDAFAGPRAYVDALAAAVHPHVGPVPPAPPHERLCQILERLVAALPPGDHRLLCALVPAQVDDPEGLAGMAEQLFHATLDPRLRLVVRDDPRAPRHLLSAETCPSEHVLAYRFSLPPAVFVAALATTAHDPRRPPAERAQALVQLACLDLGHGRLDDARARCDVAARMPVDPAIQGLARAVQADVLRRVGDRSAALAAGTEALRLAAAAGALPIVVHAASTLGELARDLGRTTDAIACFALAERASTFDPAAVAHARARRIALEEAPC